VPRVLGVFRVDARRAARCTVVGVTVEQRGPAG
jgi:hypothetical protein